MSVKQFVYSPHTTCSPDAERLIRVALPALPVRTHPATALRPLRTFFVLLVLALCAVAALAVASPASAATECGKKVLADWYDNGRIDRLYPLNCYEEAIDAIPADLRPYADAEEVITRALQAALEDEYDQSRFEFHNTTLGKKEMGGVIGAVDVYVSDAGAIMLTPDAHMRTRTVILLDPECVQTLWLQDYEHEELAKTGAYTKHRVGCNLTLKVSNPRGIAKIADLT